MRGSETSHQSLPVAELEPWLQEAVSEWDNNDQRGLVAVAPGLSITELPQHAVAKYLNGDYQRQALVIVPPGRLQEWVDRFQHTLDRPVKTVIETGYRAPSEPGQIVLAETQDVLQMEVEFWTSFIHKSILILLDADGINSEIGSKLQELQPVQLLSVTRQPSALDTLLSRGWSRVFGPLVFRMTEAKAIEKGLIVPFEYDVEIEVLKASKDDETDSAEGPWDVDDLPVRLPVFQVGQFLQGRVRDLASDRCNDQLPAIHDGPAIPGASRTYRVGEYIHDKSAPSEVVNAQLQLEVGDLMLMLRTHGDAFQLHDYLVLPHPRDVARTPPSQEAWSLVMRQLDRVTVAAMLSKQVRFQTGDLTDLVRIALALRGLSTDTLFVVDPIVKEAVKLALSEDEVEPQRLQEVAKSHGGLAAALLLAGGSGPVALLRLAHPGFTPHLPDLPSPFLYDAMSHAWRGMEFMNLAGASMVHDVVGQWGLSPEMRFVFPSSHLLELASDYCQRNGLQHPLFDSTLGPVKIDTQIQSSGKSEATEALQTWADALGQAEQEERRFLGKMHAVQPERERRRQGMCLPDLVVSSSERGFIHLFTPKGRFPATNISAGCEVELVEPGTSNQLAKGQVVRMSGSRIVIEQHRDDPRIVRGRVTVNLTFDAKVFESYQGAVQMAQRSMSFSSFKDDTPDGLLRAMLLGESGTGRRKQSIDGTNLTPSQKGVIDGVLSGGRVHLVLGPPGTGKTHTLTHMAGALARAGHSILVTADSNAAVDHLALALRRQGQLVLRVAHAANLREEAVEACRVDPAEAPAIVPWAIEHGIIIATTNYAAAKYLDPKGSQTQAVFDYVIHDEAGQSTAPSSLAAVMRGRRLVLAGDPKQLPPTVVSMDAKEAGLETTLFEKIEDLTGNGRTTMLETQFRMRKEIVQFSNKRYYEGRLDTAEVAANQETLREWPCLSFQHVTGQENPRAKNGSISNDIEVGGVVHFVDMLRKPLREKGWTMAILTPYQAQREAIKRLIGDVEVSTVDAAQGREWDVVLFTSVRSNHRHRMGFLSDERRLNVAVTRAKRHFILLGDERTLRASDAFSELLNLSEKVRRYYPDPSKRPENLRARRDKAQDQQQAQERQNRRRGGSQEATDRRQGRSGTRRRRGREPQESSDGGSQPAESSASNPAPQSRGGNGNGRGRNRNRRGRSSNESESTHLEGYALDEDGLPKRQAPRRSFQTDGPTSEPAPEPRKPAPTPSSTSGTCKATKKDGTPCTAKAKDDGFCGRHQG